VTARTVQLCICVALLALAVPACGKEDSGGQAPGAGSTASTPAAASPSVVPDRPANELGEIPVLMIHKVEAHPMGDYAQTPEQLRTHLEYLASNGYVPITAAELVRRDIPIPAGASPVVLTFDDGYASQFRLLPDGSVDPQTAVGIVLSVRQRHPQFRAVGTMYINQAPFGATDAGPELRWLVEHGWEIGNHTSTHANLRMLSAAAAQKTIAEEHHDITTAVPGYQVTTLALPFGATPADPTLAHRGSADGQSYDYGGVMLVGANPAPSPFAADWDPFNIPRIRSWHGRIDYDEEYWMPRLAQTRYVSDGDPEKVSYPRSTAVEIAKAFAGRATPY
jgi:peptidoglycan/xylan/chitin deacetylase (PgdA/CDA1 family)